MTSSAASAAAQPLLQPSTSNRKLALDLSSIVPPSSSATSLTQPNKLSQPLSLPSQQQQQPQAGLQLKPLPLAQQLPDNIDDVDFEESDDDDLDEVDFELINELKSAHAAAIKPLHPSSTVPLSAVKSHPQSQSLSFPQSIPSVVPVPSVSSFSPPNIAASLDRDWDAAKPLEGKPQAVQSNASSQAAAAPAAHREGDDDDDWGDIDLPAAPTVKQPSSSSTTAASSLQPLSLPSVPAKKTPTLISRPPVSQASVAVTVPDDDEDDMMEFEAGEVPLKLKPGLVVKEARKPQDKLSSSSSQPPPLFALIAPPPGSAEPGVYFDAATGKWQACGAAAATPDDIDDAFAAADAEDAAAAAQRAQALYALHKGSKTSLALSALQQSQQQPSRVQPRSEIPLGEFDLSEELLAHFRQCQRQHEIEYASAYRDAEVRGFPVVEESAEELTAALLAP